MGLLALGALVAVPGASARAAPPPPAEVVVLSTLHQLHADVEGYSFEVLSRLVEWLEPGVIAVELSPGDLDSRREQATKQEYARSVFPLLAKHDYTLVPLEPSEPRWSELVGLFRRANRQLAEEQPVAAAAFDTYVQTLYELLLEKWRSPADVNSRETDALFEAKHRFQARVFGPDEATAWESWNEHFLGQVLAAARRSEPGRILVLVGAEHAYWLRGRLAGEDSVVLADTPALLAAWAKRPPAEGDPESQGTGTMR